MVRRYAEETAMIKVEKTRMLSKCPLKYVKLLRYGINVGKGAGIGGDWAIELWRDWYYENVKRSRPWA